MKVSSTNILESRKTTFLIWSKFMSVGCRVSRVASLPSTPDTDTVAQKWTSRSAGVDISERMNGHLGAYEWTSRSVEWTCCVDTVHLLCPHEDNIRSFELGLGHLQQPNVARHENNHVGNRGRAR